MALTLATASADHIQLDHGTPHLARRAQVIQQTASIILAALGKPAAEQGEAAEQAMEEKPDSREVAYADHPL